MPTKQDRLDAKRHGMRKTMTVKVHNVDQSQAMIFSGVDNTYIKEGFYCLVFRERNEVQKYPLARIFRVIEPYDAGEVASAD